MKKYVLFIGKNIKNIEIDSFFVDESISAYDNGFDKIFLDYEKLLLTNKINIKFTIIDHDEPCIVLYRGWNLTDDHYWKLYNFLIKFNLFLVDGLMPVLKREPLIE